MVEQRQIDGLKTLEIGTSGDKSYGIFKCGYLKSKDGTIKEIPITQLPKELIEIYKQLAYNKEI